ncbi:MAG: gliding motility-associated C-terminal domain-containing protein [Bacteroidales bacterium]|nr:gliding motility-associated C-terminal domain-containing protein [Bacteroidales bacterium]
MKLLRIILVFVCAVIATGTYAQDCDEYTVSAQNGNAYYTPVNNFYRYSFTQQIFTPGEVGSTGNITNIAFKYCYTSPSTKKNNVKIYLGHTNKDVFNSTTDWVSPNTLTLVYTGDLNCSTGWNDFELDVPFAYNGVDNLIVCVDDESNQYDGSSYTFYYTNCTGNKTLTYQNDATSWTNSTSNSGTLRSYRPDICFKFCEPYAMSSGTHTLTTCNVTIYDNGGPSGNYAANSNDTLIIYPSTNDCKVSLTGGTYNMANQSSGGIPYDYIKIFNGDDVSGTLLSTLSGLNGTITTPITSTASNGALTIVFHSNESNEREGFKLIFNCECPITSINMSGTQTITTCGITIYDNGGPDDDYGYNRNDTLIIYPSNSGCMVSLTGTYDTETYYDTIKIYNGTGVTGTPIAALAGNGSVTSPITSTANNGAITILFHSDGSVNYGGFELYVDCAGGCSCGIGPSGLNATTGDQQITLTWNAAAGASGYLIEYGPHGFTPGTGTQVSTNNTSYTFNNLVNGAELDFYVSMICNGTPITPVMISATPNNTYNMTSGTHTITSCGTIVYDNGGPNGDYSTYSNDTLIIYPSSSGCMVSLTGTYVTESVTWDYIKIFNGTGTSGTLLATLAGTGSVTTPIYSSAPNGALTVVFHSDGSGQYSGYEFNIQCICNIFQVADTVCFGGHYQNYGFDTTFVIPGSHSLSHIDQNGTLFVLQLYVLPKNHISITGDHYFCADSTITLTASPGVSYFWNTGATTQSISVSQNGTYQVTVTDNYGCTTTATHTITSINDFISSISIPDMCAGNSYLITGSYETESEIQMYHTQSTLSIADTAFLPDGIPCDPYGCSYRSTLTFTDYSENAIVESVDDIYYVKINLEHSWIGDIYINITCPNGQKADIMRWSGSGSTECSSLIPESSRGWQTGSNYGNSAYFGQANDDEDYDNKCDKNASENAPGIGWNYCWSNNTSQGYTYAADGGLVYRSANVHNGSVDSSNVAAGTQYYHPDEAFESLIGCPLNGDWYIEVMDGWGVDNGYIFGWELALTEELLISNNFDVSYITPDSIWTTVLSDTSFTISPPADLSGDTTILYTLHFYDSEGCSFDTIVPVQVYAAPHIDIWVTTCDDYEWNGVTYTASGEYTRTFSSAAGCDSVVTLHLTINDTIFQEFDAQNCYSYDWNGTVYTQSGDYIQSFTAHNGCDSVVTLHLTINDTIFQEFDAQNCYSYDWNGTVYTQSGDYVQDFTAHNGCDSIVTLHLTINTPVHTATSQEQCGGTFIWNGTEYAESGDYTFSHEDGNGCIQVDTLHLVIHPLPETPILSVTDNTSCTEPNGSISIIAPTGDGLTYSLNGGTPQSENSFSGLTTGTFTITVWNNNGCSSSASDSVSTIGSTVNVAASANSPCVNGTLELSASSESSDVSFEWTGPNNFSSSESQHIISNVSTDHAGVYTVVVTEIATGCTASASTTVSIHTPTTSDTNATACYSFLWHGETFTVSGDYRDTLANINGCDSVVTLHLTINDTVFHQFEAQSCYSYDWNNTAYTQSGDYVQYFTAQNGCDSIVTLHLTINDTVFHQFEAQSCYSYDWNNTAYTQSGDYVQYFTAQNGCDSIVTLHLTINDTVFHQFDAQSCYSYEWNNTTYSLSGDYVQYFTAQNGCDSVVTLHLTISDTVFHQFEAKSCYSYDWNNTTYTQSGDYVQSFTAQNGCDSIVTLHLTISDTVFHQFEAQSCYSYEWNNTIYTQSGDYVQYFTAQNGCDSVVTLHLTISDTVFHQFDAQSCYSYEWNNTIYTLSGDYVQYFTAANGCDSVVTLHLTINTPTHTATSQEQCGGTFTWNGTEYAESGDYTFSHEDDNGCIQVDTLHLIIHPLPETPVLTATDNTSCADPNGAITIESPIGSGFSYSINGTDFQPQTTFNGLNTGDFTVTVMDEYGCTSTATVNVGTVGNTVTAAASANTPCAGGVLELYAETETTGATFAWSGPNNYSSNEQNPALEYASTNLNGEYALTVTDPVTHCSMSANVYVNVISPNVGNISINGVTILCDGESTDLTAFAFGNNGDVSFTWNNGDIGATVTMTPTESTTYTVTATATIDDCSASVESSVDVTVNALPQVNISGEFSFCQGESTTLIATEGYTYLWDNNLPSQSISVSEGGTYTVTVTDDNNCSNSASVTVNMLALPAIPSLTSTDNTSCADPNGTITVDSPVGLGFTYSINGADFQTETVFTDLHPGDYIITVMDENGCVNNASVNVGAVGNTVDAVASANTPCAGEPLVLTAETGTSAAIFDWTGPNGYSSNEQNPTRDNANDNMSGQYTLTVTNPETHCSAASNVIVTVNSPNTGIVNIYGVTTLCLGDSTELIVTPTGGNGEFSYVWNTGDTTTNISLNPVESATYTVSTTAVVGDCSASTETSVNVIVNPLPDANISGITAFCEDDVQKLTAAEGIAYHWSNNSTTQSIYVFESSTYSVTVTDINNCSNSDSVSVELLPLPSTPTLTPTDNSSCTVPNGAITVDSPIGAGFTYSIDDIDYQAETTFNGLDAGNYIVIVFNEYGCASAGSVSVGQIGNMVDATASANTPCAGETLVLAAETNTSAATFSWAGPDSFSSNEQNPIRENANEEMNGQYILTVTDSVTHCSMTDTVLVSVISPNTGTITIIGDTVLCQGDSTELTITVSDNNGNLSYLWDTGETTTTVSANPSQSTTYTVTTTATLDGCSTSAETSVNVIVNTLPDISISGTLIFCDGEVQELTASNGYNYLWGNNSTSQSILVSEGGEYAVTATDSNGCSNSTSVNVTVNPIIHVTIDTTICHEASYPFDNQSITTSGTYIDTLTSSYGCDSIVTLNLIVADELRDSLLVDICLGDRYFHPYFGELSPTETHTYQTVVTLDQGCSQTFSLTLTVHQPKETHIETSLCVGDTYQDNGFYIIATHATDTTYILNDTTTFGCDSTIFLHLIVHPSTDTTFLVTIVQNDLPFELNSTYYYATGIYTQDTLNIFGCDSIITLNLIVNENVSNEIDSTICDNALPMTWNSVEFLTAGDTTITLTAATGADSVLTMHLHVNPTYHIDIFDTVCAGVYFESHGFQTISFSDTILSHNDLSVTGCDSVTTLHLTVKQPTAFTDVHDTCDSFTWIDGVTYTESTTEPTVTLINTAGCDSVITLHLTIRKSTDYTDVHDTCDSFTWIDGITYTESTNTPTVTLVNAAGCDSVVTLNLTIRRSTTFTDVFDTCCNSFTWIDGITYTESTNSPTFTLTNTVGCDSVVSLQLTIRKPTIYTDTHDTCDNFTWINGITYTESTNTPTVTLTNAAGCDSVVTLNLTIYHPIHSAVTETACESFTWNNQTYLQSGTYTFAHPDENSCTQVDTLHLTVNYPVHTSITETACESYLWNGQTYTSSGTYTFSHEDANGCTQVDTLHLTVNYPTHTAMADTACESYTWNNQTYTQSGTYTFSHNDANGCTQVDTLHLIVHHTIHIATTENACESFEWNGTTYTESGTYLFTHLDAHGCTQVDTLHLTIHLPVHTAISQFTCDNYLWNDKIYSASGTYLFSHLDENGCEQVDTLHLTFVDPTTSITSLTNHFCSEGRLVLEVQTQLEDYVWSTGETSQTIIVNEEGTYTVTASQGDCEAVAAFTIEPCELEILLPNAIHPDGNGMNEFFSIAEAYYDQINDFGFSIYIYNRWGVLVFSSTSKFFQWNGEVNGTIYHDNVYNYIIEYRTKSGSPRNLKGSITVL